MLSRNYLPQVVKCEVVAADGLDVAAKKRSEDGARLQLQVVNPSDKPVTATIRLAGFTPAQPIAKVIELAGPLDGKNSAEKARSRRAEGNSVDARPEGRRRAANIRGPFVHDHSLRIGQLALLVTVRSWVCRRRVRRPPA